MRPAPLTMSGVSLARTRGEVMVPARGTMGPTPGGTRASSATRHSKCSQEVPWRCTTCKGRMSLSPSQNRSHFHRWISLQHAKLTLRHARTCTSLKVNTRDQEHAKKLRLKVFRNEFWLACLICLILLNRPIFIKHQTQNSKTARYGVKVKPN